jgi:hypothetical protein
MLHAGLWTAQKRRRRKLHPPRERRPQFGELIQIDGSPHDWFEGRAPRCTLIVFIDDATGQLLNLHFAPTETTWAYLRTLRGSLERYGRPLAIYSDRHSIFQAPRALNRRGQTQFSRALQELDIELILATSPQAKGRVERANQTLQRRLLRELRLRSISSIDEANHYLPQFLEDHNARFARTPRSDLDAHRPVTADDLDHILCIRFERQLSKDHTLQVDRTIYLIDDPRARYRLPVTVRNAKTVRLACAAATNCSPTGACARSTNTPKSAAPLVHPSAQPDVSTWGGPDILTWGLHARTRILSDPDCSLGSLG